jgi:hypothetical protein
VDELAGWRWSDAWVFAAVIGVCGGTAPCSLGELVAAGDGINHALFTDVELERGVRRLLGAGLVTTRGRCFHLTEPGRALADRRSGGLFGQVDHLLVALRRLPLTEQPWNLEPGELGEAVRWWQTRAGRITAQMKRTNPSR